MSRLSRIVLAWFVCGLAVGTLSVAIIVRQIDYPILSVLPSGVWLLANKSCPATVRLVRDIKASPELLGSVLIVPSEDEDEEFSAQTCDLLTEQLSMRRSWLQLFPSDLLCKLIVNEAAVFQELSFVASPAIALDMKPLPPATTIVDALSATRMKHSDIE